MPKETEKRSAEYRAGLFIIISLALLIFSILWLRYFAIRPYMTIIAKFKDPGPIAKGLQVYYQGVNVGRVSNIDFTEDYKYTLVYMSIYRKNLKLPANVAARIDSQGITGQKFLNITYPDHPVPELLTDGSVIKGEIPFGLADLQEILGEQIKSGNLQRMLTNFERSFQLQEQLSIKMEKLAISASSLIEENREKIGSLIDAGMGSVTNLNGILSNINDVIGDPETKRSIKSTIKGAGLTASTISDLFNGEGFNNTMSDIRIITKNIREITEDKETKEGLRNTFKLMGEASNTLSSFKSSGILDKISGKCAPNGGNIIDLATDTLYNTNQAAKSVNCLSQGMSDIFNKRFALLRLLYGRPGASLEECKMIGKMSKEQIEFFQKQGVIEPSCKR
jgi:phospholipid/cholesterol/gamma-HCH transport system substrate-binding protein